MLVDEGSGGPPHVRAAVLAAALAVSAFVLSGGGAAADIGGEAGRASAGIATGSAVPARGWAWPLASFRLEQPYAAPADEYGPGHRGVDLRPLAEGDVEAPASGVVAFSGRVADRGILTIDHGDGLVTTLEPIESGLEVGVPVQRGAPVGTVALGGHTAPGALHFGVRLHGEYINPLVLLDEVPRAVLLPCC
jgi:murein DD-endopeptidase MepM/ murein hydrolase activator NlpD